MVAVSSGDRIMIVGYYVMPSCTTQHAPRRTRKQSIHNIVYNSSDMNKKESIHFKASRTSKSITSAQQHLARALSNQGLIGTQLSRKYAYIQRTTHPHTHTNTQVSLGDVLEETDTLSPTALRAMQKAVHAHPHAQLPRLKLAFALAKRGQIASAAVRASLAMSACICAC